MKRVGPLNQDLLAHSNSIPEEVYGTSGEDYKENYSDNIMPEQ